MKINFENSISDFQDARKLKIILEHYAQSDIADKPTILFIESILEELTVFLANPEFQKFNHTDELEKILAEDTVIQSNLIGRLVSVWRTLAGPSKREILLSKQRQELIERAERAESMAFDALSETAEVGRQRDSALKRLKEIENKQ